LEECGEEITDEAAAALEEFFKDIKSNENGKIDSYVAVLRSYELRAAARKEEAERLMKRVTVDENQAKRLKERLKLYLALTGRKKIETLRYRVSVAVNGGRTPLDIDEQALPAEYNRVVTEPDRELIYQALKSGPVPGVVEKARGTHLRIS
jgi:hypothetical protein